MPTASMPGAALEDVEGPAAAVTVAGSGGAAEVEVAGGGAGDSKSGRAGSEGVASPGAIAVLAAGSSGWAREEAKAPISATVGTDVKVGGGGSAAAAAGATSGLSGGGETGREETGD